MKHIDVMFCSSEKINGNKTDDEYIVNKKLFCSSEKINGNKTWSSHEFYATMFCSSEKINGNKTNPKNWIKKDCFVLAKKLMVTKHIKI